MAVSSSTTTTLSLKLLIDTHGKKVLFAEANKDFVDFLFHMLSLPLNTLLSLLKNQQNVGSLSNLYASIENLNETYLQPNLTKNAILKPASGDLSSLLRLQGITVGPQVVSRNFYRCGSCNGSYNYNFYISDNPNADCSNCGQKINKVVSYVPCKATANTWVKEVGFVKGVVTYMVMDDLDVKPLSTISCIALLNKFNVKDVSALVEKVVDFGTDEAVKLLSASLHSKKVLSDVFINAATSIKQ